MTTKRNPAIAKILTLTVALFAITLLAEPAMAAGKLATVHLSSIPSGARVVVRSQTVGTTPTQLRVPPGRPYSFTLRKRGYRPERVRVAPLRPGQTKRMTVRLKRAR